MSKSLLGGSAAAAALLSASFVFYAVPSLAEPLTTISKEAQAFQTEQKSVATHVTTADVVATAAAAEETTIAVKSNTPVASTINAGKAARETVTDAGGAPQNFVATAYSLRGRTASGRGVSRGLIAADRKVLPLGSRVRLTAGSYSGDYLVADTGGAVRGRKIDIWMPSTGEAMRFGRRTVKLSVLSYGRKSTPRARLKRQR